MKLTFVVVDPVLTAVLRPHQREVILHFFTILHFLSMILSLAYFHLASFMFVITVEIAFVH